MNKQQILDEIRRLTAAANGKVPGSQRFKSETGIGKHGWYPKYWLRWGDAIREAGLEPNSLSAAFSTDFLVIKYINLIREPGRFPIEGDLIIKRQQDKTFPNRRAFSTLRREGEIALQLPEKLEPIHYIKTDDPSGIEKYWHGRFADKRKEGEWFALSAGDVQAFKKWKRIS